MLLAKFQDHRDSDYDKDQSINCHIHWLARACRCILVTKIRLSVFHCGNAGIKEP